MSCFRWAITRCSPARDGWPKWSCCGRCSTCAAARFGRTDAALRDDTSTNTRFVKIRYRADDGEHAVWCRIGTIPWESLGPSVLWFVLKLGLFAIGALVFWKRPADPSAAQFFVLCIVTLCAFMGGYHWVRIATPAIPLARLHGLRGAVAGGEFAFLPDIPATQDVPRRSATTLAGVYVPPTLFLWPSAAAYFYLRAVLRGGQPEADFAPAWSILRTLGVACIALAALWYFASVIGFVHSFLPPPNSTERNQVKWILFGSHARAGADRLLALPGLLEPERLRRRGRDLADVRRLGLLDRGLHGQHHALPADAARPDHQLGRGYFLISFLAGLVYYGLVFAGHAASWAARSSSGPSLGAGGRGQQHGAGAACWCSTWRAAGSSRRSTAASAARSISSTARCSAWARRSSSSSIRRRWPGGCCKRGRAAGVPRGRGLPAPGRSAAVSPGRLRSGRAAAADGAAARLPARRGAASAARAVACGPA